MVTSKVHVRKKLIILMDLLKTKHKKIQAQYKQTYKIYQIN
jgi:hypothetical protein